MTDITRFVADKLGPVKSGPEQYAPPDRRAPKKTSDFDQAAANAFEGELREFVRRETAFPRRERSAGNAAAAEPLAENLNLQLRRVAGTSMEEIDQVILELQRVRDMLHRESERLSREISRYASLNRHLMTGMKIIAENLKQWKGDDPGRGQLMAEFKARWLGGNVDD
jgi:hypothetical protein